MWLTTALYGRHQWHVADHFAACLQYEPIISADSEHVVHHMELFHCQTDADTHVPLYNGPGQAEGKPPELEVCRQVIGAWAMGAPVSAHTMPRFPAPFR